MRDIGIFSIETAEEGKAIQRKLLELLQAKQKPILIPIFDGDGRINSKSITLVVETDEDKQPPKPGWKRRSQSLLADTIFIAAESLNKNGATGIHIEVVRENNSFRLDRAKVLYTYDGAKPDPFDVAAKEISLFSGGSSLYPQLVIDGIAATPFGPHKKIVNTQNPNFIYS